MTVTNGLLVINKPKDVTSRDVVNEVSKILKTKKIGHTGTLDPIATGVLVLTVGKATKLSEIITSEEKVYQAEVILGLKTDTLDVTGNILDEYNTNYKEEDIIKVLNSFIGTYNQEVPIYSAVKIKGKKLYEYARNNEEVTLPKRMVTIKDIKLDELNYFDNKTVFKFTCKVSKGTYIRSLINDIANKLNTIGTMKNLIRIEQGKYNIKDSYTIEDVKNNNYKIIPIKEALKDYFTVRVDEKLKFKVMNGQILDNIYNQEYVLFVDEDVIGLYKNEGKKLKPYKMFI